MREKPKTVEINQNWCLLIGLATVGGGTVIGEAALGCQKLAPELHVQCEREKVGF